LEGSEEGGVEREQEGEEDAGQENDTCINVSSDSKYRIDYIPFTGIHSNGCFSVKYLTLR